MPTRYLKPGIRDSEPIDRLPPLAECLFYRLIVTVDDYGRADARPAMVKAQCFPIKDSIGAKVCAALLQDLAENGLVDLYAVDGKPYLQMRKWDNTPRAKESKFPAFVDVPRHHRTDADDPPADAEDLHTDACKPRTLLPVTVTVTGTETDNTIAPRKRGAADGRFLEFWTAWPKNERKQDKAKCVAFWKLHGLDDQADQILADIATKRKTQKWQEGFIEAPLVYLRGNRWLDGVTPATPGASPASAVDWRASWKTIVEKGIEIGCGDWSDALVAEGKAPPFPVYRAKVEARVVELEDGPDDPAGRERVAQILGGMLDERLGVSS